MSDPKEPSKDVIESLDDDQLEDVHGGAVRLNKLKSASVIQAYGNDTLHFATGNDTLFAGVSDHKTSFSSKKKR